MRLPKARPVLFSFLASFLIWLPGALSIVYTKYVMLTTARALNVGIVAGHASTALAELGPWQTLAVFRADLLLGWVVVPVCLLLLLAFLPRPVVTWL